MNKKRTTLTIDKDVYNKFKQFCESNNLKISKQAETVLLEYTIKMKKNEKINKNRI